eukprot:TRINITY_DN11583_c0_g1_i7.p1 TRINITY_DN11583_c0_g1~~TRINITY_DN11583_c0_g1_i7.p1  ORF type:complete len:217 (-),score=54.57 TRINITY_DN11583_c0_g1_i7:359-1009(-)
MKLSIVFIFIGATLASRTLNMATSSASASAAAAAASSSGVATASASATASVSVVKPVGGKKRKEKTPVVIVTHPKTKKTMPPPSKKIVIVDDGKVPKVPETSIIVVTSPSPVTIPSQPASPVALPEQGNATEPSPVSPQALADKDDPVVPSPQPEPEPEPLAVASPVPVVPELIPQATPCDDVPPDAEYTCAYQVSQNRCDAPFMSGFCNASCGRC